MAAAAPGAHLHHDLEVWGAPMHGQWLIDDRGTVWHAADPALRRNLGTSLAGCDLAAFLVRQMGFVAITEHPARTEIVCAPAIVSPVALTEFFYWVADRGFRPTTCSDAVSPSVARLFVKRLALHNHLSALIAARTPAEPCTKSCREADTASFSDRWSAALEICAASIETPLKLNILHDLFRGHVVKTECNADGDYSLTVEARHGDDRAPVPTLVLPIPTQPPTRNGIDAVLTAVNRN